MDTALLESLGLTHNEAIAYLTLVQLGTSKTGRILKESGLNTGKIYEILNALIQKGLISESTINNVKHFTAGTPERLLDYIADKKRKLDEEQQIANELIPQIETLRAHQIAPSNIVIYTGFEGFKTAVREATKTLKEGEEVLSMGVRSSKGEKFNKVWRDWADAVLHVNHERSIHSEEGYFLEYKKKSKYTKVKKLISTMPTVIVIFGNHTVLIIRYKDPIKAIVINDDVMSTTFISLFEQMWLLAQDP